MTDTKKLTTTEKALEINLVPEAYGSFAEIGAGQEVARWFFRAGKASATIAKTISAYDMAYSDYLYGAEENNRYVCESRLRKMLDREYTVLTERTSRRTPEQTRYFAFADTIASKKSTDGGGHGWMGLRFQHAPLEMPSEIILHVRLHDDDVLTQQEAVGILGVNLVHASIQFWKNPKKMISQLKDGLKKHKLEIDMIHFWGPAFPELDNRVMGVALVELGYTNAVIFTPEGETLQPTDALYKKNVLVQRGRFRPLTRLHIEMFEAGKRQFCKDPSITEETLISFFEITLADLMIDGVLDTDDFLARVDMIQESGHHVMISNYGEYFRLSEFFSRQTQSKIGMIMGVGHLKLVFDEKFYSKVPGGMMSALGQLFSKNVTGLIFPAYSLDLRRPAPENLKASELLTAERFAENLDEKLRDLYRYMHSNHALVDIEDVRIESLNINSETILAQIASGDPKWEHAVPRTVANLINRRGLYRNKAKASAA